MGVAWFAIDIVIGSVVVLLLVLRGEGEILELLVIFLSISWNCWDRLLSMLSWNFFHLGFFPFCPLFLIPFDDDEELLLCQLGEKHGFLTVFGVGTQRGGGDGDSCLMGFRPEYLGLSRHQFSSCLGHMMWQ